jgi:Haem-NO-binding
MHGSLLHGFKQFIHERDGAEAWRTIARAAHTGGWYFTTKSYDDEELMALVRAAAAHEQRSEAQVLREFGTALVPTLMHIYGAFVDPEWRTMDVLANAERVIHKTVRLRDPNASPPALEPRPVSPTEVHIAYASPRRLCAVAEGICHGVASYFGEALTVAQPECMHRGDARCLLVAKLVGQ